MKIYEAFVVAMERMEAHAQKLIDHPDVIKDVITDLELVKLIARHNIDNQEEAGLSSFLATLCTVYLTKPQLWYPLQEGIIKTIAKRTNIKIEEEIDCEKRHEK